MDEFVRVYKGYKSNIAKVHETPFNIIDVYTQLNLKTYGDFHILILFFTSVLPR